MQTAFSQPGHWYRGNLHMHSTASDGKISPEEALQWYRERGYDFVSLTDHRHTTDTAAFNDDNFLVLPGMELDCVDGERDVGYHIVGIGIEPFAQDEATRRGAGQRLVDAIRGHGGEAILAHPYWLGQDRDDLLAVSGAFGIEVFNTTCARAGKEYGMVHWDNLLDRGVKIWGLATDDAHRYTDDAGGGWVMVKAGELSAVAIMQALRHGHFYSTQGPAITDVRIEGGTVHVHTSPVKEIRFIANRGRGRHVVAQPGQLIHSAKRPVRNGGYMRIEAIDEHGRRAWSQPMFFD